MLREVVVMLHERDERDRFTRAGYLLPRLLKGMKTPILLKIGSWFIDGLLLFRVLLKRHAVGFVFKGIQGSFHGRKEKEEEEEEE